MKVFEKKSSFKNKEVKIFEKALTCLIHLYNDVLFHLVHSTYKNEDKKSNE